MGYLLSGLEKTEYQKMFEKVSHQFQIWSVETLFFYTFVLPNTRLGEQKRFIYEGEIVVKELCTRMA